MNEGCNLYELLFIVEKDSDVKQIPHSNSDVKTTVDKPSLFSEAEMQYWKQEWENNKDYSKLDFAKRMFFSLNRKDDDFRVVYQGILNWISSLESSN